MSDGPMSETLAIGLPDRLRESGIGVIRVWGADVIRPSDQIYELKSATVAGSVLRLVLFLALDGQERLVEVDQPRGAKVAKGALRIQSAAAVRVFGSEYKPPSLDAKDALYLGV